MILYVSPSGEVRNYQTFTEVISVGPILSRIGDRLVFTATMSTEEIVSLGQEYRVYQQRQISHG